MLLAQFVMSSPFRLAGGMVQEGHAVYSQLLRGQSMPPNSKLAANIMQGPCAGLHNCCISVTGTPSTNRHSDYTRACCCPSPLLAHLSMSRICSSFLSTAASVLRRPVTSAVQPSTSS
jgi:hypothetical protein